MKKLFILPFAFILLMGAGCTQAPTDTTTDTTDEPENETVTESESTAPDYVGTWHREEIYVDGVLEPGPSDATLVFNEDNTFRSETDICYVTGTIEVDENNIRMLTEDSDCPAEAVAMTSDMTYEYEISEGGNAMTNTTVYSGVTIMEVYSRVTE